jgi:hypothetical protein
MAEARDFWRDDRPYVGIDLLQDLNRGLFSELEAKAPRIDLYRRTLQRSYITRLRVVSGKQEDPEETASTSFNGEERDRGSPSRFRKSDRSLQYFTSNLASAAQAYQVAPGSSSEFRAALNEGVMHLGRLITRALPRVKDPETAAHLRDLVRQLEGMI